MGMYRNRFLLRFLAAFTLVSVANQIFFPTVSYALTGGPTQIEVSGYQSPGATDNVNIASGAFNYTVPIASVPQYPLGYGYRPGMGMEAEASAFGFNGNSYSGAITRGLVGLPDDLNGGGLKYRNDNQVRQSGDLGATLGIGAGLPLGGVLEGLAVGVGASIGLTLGYDNYSGAYGSISFGVGLGLGNGGDEDRVTSILEKSGLSESGVGLGAGVVFDSRQRKAVGDIGYSVSIGESYNDGALSWGVGYGGSLISGQHGAFVSGGVGLPGGVGVTSTANFIKVTDEDLAKTIPNSYASSFSLTIPIPVPQPMSLSVTGSYSRFEMFNENQDYTVFGMMHLKGYDRSQAAHMADFYVEREDSWSDTLRHRLNPSFLQKDHFNISAGGVGGTMSLQLPKHGVVSRQESYSNQKDVSALMSKYDRRRVESWDKAEKAVFKKELNLIELLRNATGINAGRGLFDKEYNVLDDYFDKGTIENLNTSETRFSQDISPEFKLRGDMGGSYRITSNKGSLAPNPVSLQEITQSGNKVKLKLFALENRIPVYKPSSQEAFGQQEPVGSLQASSQITYDKVGDILSAAAGEDYFTKGDNLSGADLDNYFTHVKVDKSGITKNGVHRMNDHLSPMNSLSALQAMTDAHPEVSDQIGGISMVTASGMKYVFNLPVFAKESRSLSLKGKGKNPPYWRNGDYYSTNKEKQVFLKRSEEKNFVYPYAWNLTAVVGPDYIDFDDVPGPSDGDIGYWVKFKYVKAEDDYRWRTPFEGMEHHEGAPLNFRDDMYTVRSGTKEIYYLHQVESSTHVSEYTYHTRLDARSAAGFGNGHPVNKITKQKSEHASTWQADLTGEEYQYAATEVAVYKKHYQANNSAYRPISQSKGRKIRSTKFFYDYSICPDVPNSYQKELERKGSALIKKSALPYHYAPSAEDAGTGKLTLRRIQNFTYAYGSDGSQSSAALPPYDFTYTFDEQGNDYNPSYDPKCVDYWGNYSKNAKKTVTQTGIYNFSSGQSGQTEEYDVYQHYTELSKTMADQNAGVYLLKRVGLPSGGEVEVDYEARSYSYVEDKVPYVARHIEAIEYVAGDDSKARLKVEITELVGNRCPEGGSCAQDLLSGFSFEGYKLLEKDKPLVGTIAFYQGTARKGHRDIQVVADTVTFKGIYGAAFEEQGRYFALAEVQKADGTTPFKQKLKTFIMSESPYMKALMDLVVSDYCGDELDDNVNDIDDAKRTQFGLDLVKEMAANFKRTFVSDNNYMGEYESCSKLGEIGKEMLPHLSFVRTRIDKEKYTGYRVRKMTYRDNFQYATTSEQGPDQEYLAGKDVNEYSTVYAYDREDLSINPKGRTVSSGVATIEPGAGIDIVTNASRRLGNGFASAPAIFNARTTVALDYSQGVNSREKGMTEYQFFTPGTKFNKAYDNTQYDLSYEGNFKHESAQVDKVNGSFTIVPGLFSWVKIKVKIPFVGKVKIPFLMFTAVTLRWNRRDYNFAKSYAYRDVSDMYGKLKSVRQLGAENSSGVREVVSSSEYSYFHPEDDFGKIPTLKPNPSDWKNGQEVKKDWPGMVEQSWGESYMTTHDNVHRIASIVILGTTRRRFHYIDQREVYLPPILKSVKSTYRSESKEAENKSFDFYTGAVLESEGENENGDKIINTSVPAYWKHADLGVNGKNILGPTILAKQYLGSKDDDNLLGVSQGYWSELSQGEYALKDSYLPIKEYDGNGQFRYTYKSHSGTSLAAAYDGSSNTALHFERPNKVYRPNRSYVYKTDLDADGTYLNGNYTDDLSDYRWEQVSQVTLYDVDGTGLEVKDILNKYAASRLGYNYNYNVTSMVNARESATAFESGENSYVDAVDNTKVLLDDKSVVLGSAKIVTPGCQYETRTISYAQVVDQKNSLMLYITLPSSSISPNTPFALLRVRDKATGLRRTLFISENANRKLEMVSSAGDYFKGFFSIDASETDRKVFFSDEEFDEFTIEILDNSYRVVELDPESVDEQYSGCVPSISYGVPIMDCVPDVHAGKYAFKLEPLEEGTVVSLDRTAMEQGQNLVKEDSQFDRKYKAMVWVHASSSEETTLKAEVLDGSGNVLQTVSANKSQPYATAGDWSLLRVDVDKAYMEQGSSLRVKVVNASNSNTSLYDDIKVAPYHSVMTSTIYEHTFGRVLATLDDDHFATRYTYDERGRLVQVESEVDGIGQTVLKQYKYNEQKQ